MLNLILRYRIITDRGLGVVAGNYINVYWDDVSEDLEVQQFDDSSDLTGTVITSGPDLGARDFDFEIVQGLDISEAGFAFSNYRFCDGEDLNRFFSKGVFPYVEQIETEGHFSCQVNVVCDIQISGDYTVTEATDFTTADGSLTVTATSSNGDIRYSLDPNFSFDQGQETGSFIGLFPGEYTVSAKDESGCTDTIIVTVPVPNFYNPLYRLDYVDRRGKPTRIDILQRGYEGSPIDVKGSEDPFVLKYNADGETNKFTPIVPSQATLTLLSESNFYFRDLFTQDERKYKITYSKDLGNSFPSFTPDTLTSLENWIDTGTDWSIDSTPSIAIIPGVSSYLYTDYEFVAGKTYTFDYSFSLTATQINYFVLIDIEFTNSTGANLGVNTRILPEAEVLSETVTGTIEFVAPEGADRIRIYARKKNVSIDVSLQIDYFVNTTSSEVETPVGYELKWQGYVIPANLKESYLDAPYPVTIMATCGLADLKLYDFTDPQGLQYREDTTVIKALSDILKKTDIGCNIKTAINRFEENMDQSESDDPLSQCTFNPETFYDGNEIKKCSEVLSELIKPFGARIMQIDGKWFIYSIEELVTATTYREFNLDGVYVSNGTIDTQIDIKGPSLTSRAAFVNNDQFLEIIPAYGRMYFEHSLIQNDSLIASHSFELSDLVNNSDGFVEFKNWNVNIAKAPGVLYGVKKTQSFDGDYNFYLSAFEALYTAGVNEWGKKVILLAKTFQVEFNSTDVFEFGFDYAYLLANFPGVVPTWAKISWSIKCGAYYYNTGIGWNTASEAKYNEVYITNFNQDLNYKVRDYFRSNAIVTNTENVIVEIKLEGINAYDFEDSATLKAIDTTFKSAGHKVKGFIDPAYRYYELKDGTEPESDPDIIVPDDYQAITNAKYWELTSEQIGPKLLDYIYVDNVTFLHKPSGAEPVDDVTIERFNNRGIRIDYNDTFLLNDIDLDNINNSERTYKNFFKLLDGTPTQIWERTYRPGSGKLLDLFSNDFASQYRIPVNKLTGTFDFDLQSSNPMSILIETGDEDRKYMFMGYELHDRSCTTRFDILELVDTITDPDSPDIDAGFSTGFSLGFRS